MEENIYAKLVKVQNELKAPKNQRNSFGGYNYRSAEDILEAVKPLLEKYQLAQFISDEIIIVKRKILCKNYCLFNQCFKPFGTNCCKCRSTRRRS